jgi:DNA repair protein SbcC/Rad50
MRILALRGENLASLAGKFELDLAQGPLAESGLIAITGPTGAGKSTLLDAMCLALFDRTPRLGGRGAAVGFLHEEDQKTLSSGDPRCVLRRGASSGHAEVDFLGVHGERWRARWSVRRARGRALGRLQNQQVSLENLDTGVLAGGTKTQTLAAIEEALGLDYDGFCRSALLAQGEFAGFLRAKPEERAALLERVTGTEIYGQLSIAAHQRAGRAREQVALLEARLGGYRRLPEAERERLQGELTAAEAEARAAAEALSAAEEAGAWHEQHVALRACATRAEKDLQRARGSWEAAEPQRRLLVAWELAQPLVHLQRARARAAAVAADAERELELAAVALAEASEVRERATETASVSQEAQRAADLALRSRGPKLRQAATLERTLSERTQELQRAEAALRAAQAGLEQARAEATAARASTALAREARSAGSAELEADPCAAALAQEESSWEARLARLARAAGDLPQAALEASDQSEAASLRRSETQTLEGAADEATRLAEEATQAYEGQAEQAEGWRQDRAAWTERRLRLVELREARSTALAARSREDVAQREAEAALAEVKEAEVGAEAAREAEVRAVAAADEAERAWVLLERTLQLSDLRHELREGEPCVLCGAEEHPYAEEAPPLDAVLSGQRERVQTLQEEIRRARGDRRALTERRDQASARAEQATSRAEQAGAAASVAEGRWLELAWKASWTLGRAAATLGPDAANETLGAELDEALAEAEERLASLEAQLSEREERGQALVLLRAARADAREAALRGQQALREAEAAARQAVERAAHLESKVSRALDELQAAFPEPSGDAWRAAFQADPQAFTADLRERVAAAAGARRRVEQARAELEALEPRAAATEAEVKAAERALAASQARREEARQAHLSAEAEFQELGLRVDLLPSQVLAELEAALDRAQVAQAEASQAQAHAAAALAGAEARQKQVAAAREVAREASAARASELEGARQEALLALIQRLRGPNPTQDAGSGPSEEPELTQRPAATPAQTREEQVAGIARSPLEPEPLLEEALRWTPAAAQDARDEEERLRDALRSAEHELRIRREALRAHQASGAPSLSASEAREAAAAAAPRRAEADEARARLRGVLLADESAKAEAEELSERLEEQRVEYVRWQSLSKLIGSHDGKRLRVFAQSLTLELLLDQANAALADLAPRYRLARVAGQDLDLQVIDRTLGDEVRATSSLSGGESFLVSLALALGVGALSSQEASVESLFVDEGFGSLDADAQELALAALDALQAGGRQVVLISHLPGLAERIGFGVRVVPEGRGQSRVEVGSLQLLGA